MKSEVVPKPLLNAGPKSRKAAAHLDTHFLYRPFARKDWYAPFFRMRTGQEGRTARTGKADTFGKVCLGSLWKPIGAFECQHAYCHGRRTARRAVLAGRGMLCVFDGFDVDGFPGTSDCQRS